MTTLKKGKEKPTSLILNRRYRKPLDNESIKYIFTDFHWLTSNKNEKTLLYSKYTNCDGHVCYLLLSTSGKFFSRDEDPDPVGSVDFWTAESGSVTFFIGSGSGSYL